MEYLGNEDLNDTDINLLISNNENIELDSNNVPEFLQGLIPVAQKWGTLNETLMYIILSKVSKEILEELIQEVKPYNKHLTNWLAYPPDGKTDIQKPEYRAFTNLTLGYFKAQNLLHKYNDR